MMTPDRIETAARLLVRQRLSLAPVDLAEDIRPANKFEAGRPAGGDQRQLSRSWPGPPMGQKIRCTTPVTQAYVGISSRCAGEIFAATIVRAMGA